MPPMAVMSAVSIPCDGHRGDDSLERKILPPRTTLDDVSRKPLHSTGALWRCDTFCEKRDPAVDAATPLFDWLEYIQLITCSKPLRDPGVLEPLLSLYRPDVEQPPSYTDVTDDNPPSYAEVNLAAYNCALIDTQPLPRSSEGYPGTKANLGGQDNSPLPNPMPVPSVDFEKSSNLREVANKKAKKAAKAANQAKWGDSGDEGNNDGVGGEENGDQGGGSNNGAGGAGGSGGPGGDGGGDDDWNDWNAPKKKKGKKGKGGVDEEEKRKKEEEENKKQEEEAANSNTVPWANGGDANPNDEWGVSVTANKGGKKNKKGKVNPEPAVTANPSISAFDDINLGDSPKLDLNFGDPDNKDSGSNFGFGGWGSSWNTSNKWDLGTTDTGTANTADNTKHNQDASLDGGDGGMWSFGTNKKNKKKTANTGFDFELGAVDEVNESKPAIAADIDDWGGFGKKDKKSKKKGASEDTSVDVDSAAVGMALDEPATNDSWSAWGTATSKKDKKKGKPTEVMPQAPPSPPIAPSNPAIDNSWGTFNGKKDKKAKKGAFESVAEEPAVVVVPEPEAEVDGGWPSFENKKDKKKGKKNQVEEKPDQTSTAAGAEMHTESPEVDFGWNSLATGRKDKKKTKKGALEGFTEDSFVAPVHDPEPAADLGWGTEAKKDKKKTKKGALEGFTEDSFVAPVPDPEPAADLGWGTEAKKDKKKSKKGAAEEPAKEESFATELHETGPMIQAGWGAFASNKDNKSKKKGFLYDFPTVDDAGMSQVSKPAPAADDTLGSWGTATKKDKKAKKGLISEVRDDPIAAIEPVAAAEALTADDDWMNWANPDKKDKKNKKGPTADTTKEEFLPPPPPPPPVAPEPSTTDIWGSAKKDKKGKKGGALDKTNPEPASIVPEPVEEDWGGWGLSAKDKRKKEKERKEREEREKEEKEAEEKAEQEAREQAEKEEKERAEKLKAKEKTKPGKKGKINAVSEASKMDDLMKGSVPDATPAVEEDLWANGWGSSKPQKKKGGKIMMPEIPPPVPTPPKQGLTPEPGPIPGLDDMGDDEWASFAPANPKDKKDAKTTSKIAKAEESKAAKKGVKDKAHDRAATEEFRMKEGSAAKAAKNFWGGMATTTTSKFKTAKDADRDDDHSEGEDTLKDLDLELDLDDPDDELIGIIDEPQPVKKSPKSKTDGKLSKTSSKDSRASDKASTTGKPSDKKKKGEESLLDDLLELGDEEAAGYGEDSISNLINANGDKNQNNNNDAWSFWGSTKKPSGKKADEGRKEIAKAAVAANQKGSLKKEPEATSRSTTTVAADESASQPSKSSKTTMSTIKASNKTSSVLQRVKDLEKEKEGGKAKSIETQPPAFASEPLSKIDSTPKKSNTTNKLKPNPVSGGKKKNSPPLEAKSKFSQPNNDTVPGSFPAEGAEEDDDMADMMDFSPVGKKDKNKPATAKKQDFFMDDFNFDDPAAEEVPPAPPTPPADPPPAKPAKKERARVVRDEGASSWGFWGAAPKKDAKKERKAKDDADVPSAKPKEKAPAPGFVRSKSTRTAKEKDKEVEKSSKSSGSDEKEKKSESRPAKSRGSSFGGFFGPPPARAKTVRRPSTAASKPASSRRPSVDVGATGLPSPPAESAPEMSPKAAKLMGAGPGKLDRKASTRGKQKTKGSNVKVSFERFQEADRGRTAAPDPYPIDDDDMVMIGGVDDPVIDFPPAQTTSKDAKKDKSSSSKTKPKKEPIPVDDIPEDIVMVDPTSPQEELDSPKEQLAFDERPRLQRANTSAKKSKGGLFGGFGFGKTRRASEGVERAKSSKGAATDDEGLSRRKRTVAGGEDSAKRLRRDDRKVRRSDKPDRVAEGFVYPDGGGSADAEDAEAQAHKDERRAKRAAARDTDARDAEDRRARRREAEKAEEDARKAKAKDARDRRARKEEEAEAQRLDDKRARRAAREEMNVKLGGTSRPRKSDRRKSYLDSPADEDAERRARREARRAARTPDEKSKPKAADDYFDPRNGGGGEPYMNGNDHTSSWVKSQLSDPADPPPVEGTVIDPPPVLGGENDPLPPTTTAAGAEEDEAARKVRRKSSRRQSSKYVDEDEGEARRRRKEREVRSSEGSREDERPYASSRRKSDYSGLRSYEARPSLATAGGKRGSWLKKMGL